VLKDAATYVYDGKEGLEKWHYTFLKALLIAKIDWNSNHNIK